MGRYINPGYEGFRIISKKDYVDKTGIIELINDRIDTTQRLMCVSRPRRFGKSFAAKTLCAYYDCSVDSHGLFDRFEIAKSESYEEHINKYNVIQLDITGFISAASMGMSRTGDIVNDIAAELLDDVKETFPEFDEINNLYQILSKIVKKCKKKIVFIIDEWDAIIREYSENSELQKRYLEFLRGFFKNVSFTSECIAAAYMTGILPIKKIGSQSALSDFREYTALAPGRFAGYIGFNENDIKYICEKYKLDISKMKWWYDGYTFGDIEDIYNPYSVMCAVDLRKFASYWKKTSAVDSLANYVDMNYEGLQDKIIKLIKGEEITVDTESFKNDFSSFANTDDILTLLIHLGYLTYCDETHLVRIPNEELRSEFRSMLKISKNSRLIKLVDDSRKLLEDTLAGNESIVSDAIDKLCGTNYAPQYYNNEQALRSIIKLAYLTAADQYIKIEELPSGKGLADIVYIPQRYSALPALVVELKWNKSAESAIDQIKNNDYPAVLQNFGGDILLVGVNYDADTKKHICRIERIAKS